MSCIPETAKQRAADASHSLAANSNLTVDMWESKVALDEEGGMRRNQLGSNSKESKICNNLNTKTIAQPTDLHPSTSRNFSEKIDEIAIRIEAKGTLGHFMVLRC